MKTYKIGEDFSKKPIESTESKEVSFSAVRGETPIGDDYYAVYGEKDATGGNNSVVYGEISATGGDFSAVYGGTTATGGNDSAVYGVDTATGGNRSAVHSYKKVNVGSNSVGMGTELGDIGDNSVVVILDEFKNIKEIYIKNTEKKEILLHVIE